MADRYWVGGSGTWGTGSTTNWSATSGGAGGASYPTSADNVIFDQAATYTVTCNGLGGSSSINCANLTVTAGTVTFAVTSSPVVNVYGSFTLRAGGTWSSSLPIFFKATSTGHTITTNGVSVGYANFNGVGGGWTLGSAWTSTYSSSSIAGMTFVNGTFSTNNYNITVNTAPALATATGTKTVNLGSSSISQTYSGGPSGDLINFGGTGGDAGLTLNAGTSTITGTSSGGTSNFYGAGKTFYNVTIRNATTYLGGTQIYGANTFNNLTFQGSSVNSYNQVAINANQTVNGTLTLGSSQSSTYGGAPMHVYAAGYQSGTTYTITAAAKAITYVTFQNITAAGAAAPFTGTNIGDGGGNTNITATTAKTVYWSLAAGGTWQVGSSGSIAFATSSGGAPSRSNHPLPQDTVIIDNTGLTTGNTINISPNDLICNINCTRTNAWVLNTNTGTIKCYGDITIPSVTTSSVGQYQWQQSSGLKTATFNGALSSRNIYVTAAPGSGLRLGGSWTMVLQTHTSGTIDLNGYTWTNTTFTLTQTTYPKTITANGGKFVVTGSNTTVFNYAGAYTTLTDTVAVDLTYSGSTGTRSVKGAVSPSLTADATYNQTNNLRINITAGSDAVNLSPTAYSGSAVGFVDCTGFSGSLGFTGYSTGYLTGLTLSSTMSVPASYYASTRFYSSGSITSNGVTINQPLEFGHTTVSASTTLADAFSSTQSLACLYGGLTTNNYSVTASSLSANFSTASLTLGSSAVTLSGTFGLSLNSASTFNAGTSTITFNYAGTKTFAGGGKTFYNVVNSSTGQLTITGSNTFTSFTSNPQTSPVTLQFEAGSTNTFGTFAVSGTGIGMTTLQSSSAGTRYTLSDASGFIVPTYSIITDSAATGGAYWYGTGAGTVDGGNNTGWIFNSPDNWMMMLS